MTTFLVDPKILTIPDANEDAVAVEKWWASTSAWLAELTFTRFEWRQIVECTLALIEEDRFIGFRRLQRLQHESGARINPAAVRSLERRLQPTEHDIDMEGFTKFVIAEDGDKIQPKEFFERNVEGVRSPLEEALLKLAVDKEVSSGIAGQVIILGEELLSSSASVCVSARVLLIDPNQLTESMTNKSVSQCFDFHSFPDSLVSLPPTEFISLGEAEFVRLLIKSAKTLGCSNPINCKFHPEFVSSIHSSSLAHDSIGLRNLVRTCGEILSDLAVGMAGARIEPIRSSKGGDSSQRERDHDGAKAWRATVTKGRVGWRLNFWRIGSRGSNRSELIEFAYVEKKSDTVHIPD